MATGDIVKGYDGELSIKIGTWAKDKLHCLESYCDIFNKAMKNKWLTRTYIDLLAGPGKCIIEREKTEVPGSPIIALNCKPPFTHYYFNDLEPNLIESLKARTKCYQFPNIEFLNENCNSAIEILLTKLPDRSLDFCFIDLLSWEISFSSILKLTKYRQIDLLITFHIGNIKREAANPPQELIDFFPPLDWRQLYKSAIKGSRLSTRPFLDAYENGLRNIGYKVTRDHIFTKNVKNTILYYLIFASKHEKGAYFFDEVTRRSKSGQWRMPL